MAAKLSKLLMLAVLSFLVLGACCSQGEKRGAETNASTAERVARIEKALASQDDFLVRRALLEAAPLVSDHPELVSAILANGPDKLLGLPWTPLAIRALGNAKGAGAIQVMQAYRRDPERHANLLVAIGRMASGAAELVPFLRQRLADANLESDEKAAIRTVLAAVGQATAEDLADIRRALGDLRDAQPQWQVTNTMFYVGSNEWLRPADRATLVKALRESKDSEVRGSALMALSTLGKSRDEEVLAAVRRLFRFSVEERSGEARCAGLALAVLDVPRRKATLRSLFQRERGSWVERDDMGIPDGFISVARDDQGVAQDVTSLLSESDAYVARQAACFLVLIGPTARPAVHTLLRLVSLAGPSDSAEEKELRMAAAEALGMVAYPADVPLMHELILRKDLPPDLKRAIEESIRVIELIA